MISSKIMPLYQITKDKFRRVTETTLKKRKIGERQDLQRLLRSKIDVIANDVLVIAEEFSDWEGSKCRIDLLGIDRNANIVVIELKRNDGAHMELQAVRYAAMVSTMTFLKATEIYRKHLGTDGDPSEKLLRWLNWSTTEDGQFAQNVRIILVSEDFSKELTTAVMWLNERDLDISCVKLCVYKNGAETFVNVEQVIPLPEAADYQIMVRKKESENRAAASGHDTGYLHMNVGDWPEGGRVWEDSKKYGFISAGYGEEFAQQAQKLKVGDKVFAYVDKCGYVGLGIVTAEGVPFKDFIPKGQTKKLFDLPMNAKPKVTRMKRKDTWDICVAVKWIKAVDREHGVKGSYKRGTLCRIRQQAVVSSLLTHFPDSSEKK